MESHDTRPQDLIRAFQRARAFTHELCSPLAIEDYGLQAVAETSPLKWHLAHTTWFFETFLLHPFVSGYRPFRREYEVLFNSYYNSVGAQFPRAQRHLLSRPTVSEILEYRVTVDARLIGLLDRCDPAHPQCQDVMRRVELGLHHEQQHQELMLTDLKYNFARNPLYPCYRSAPPPTYAPAIPLRLLPREGGDHWIGHDPTTGFGFDNEQPRHPVRLRPFAIANRLATNGEYRAFMDDGGYERPEFWLADGWAWLQGAAHPTQESRHQPQQWVLRQGEYFEFTLHGLQPLLPERPVTHVSYYEADAFARWQGARLCTEFEWESAAGESNPVLEAFHPQPEHSQPVHSQTSHLKALHPQPATGAADRLQQMTGSVWQWTQSAYQPYPGYEPAPGALGEYNGKFMCNQMVLRGGSCATPTGHTRPSYRNFFYPHDRWQFTGIRLARDL